MTLPPRRDDAPPGGGGIPDDARSLHFVPGGNERMIAKALDTRPPTGSSSTSRTR